MRGLGVDTLARDFREAHEHVVARNTILVESSN